MGKVALYYQQIRFLKKVAKEISGLKDKFRVDDLQTLSTSKSRSTKWRYRKTYEQLIADGFLTLSGETIQLTEQAINLLNQDKIFNFELNNQSWDGIWKVVAYDVPEKQKSERNILRRKLKAAGFRQVQDSLWVTPYECHQEIALLANELGISNYVAIMTTEKVPENDKALKFFGLK